MKVDRIGIAIGALGRPEGLEALDRHLDHFASLGYELVELNLVPFPLVIDGRLQPKPLADFKLVLNGHRLAYSVHGLLRLNLAFDPRHELCRRIMAAQLAICQAIGATRLVHHSGLQALDVVRNGFRDTLLSPDELAEGAQREVEALRELAPRAADAGVVIGLENGDSHLWEYRLLASHGVGPDALIRHHPRLHPRAIVEQLEAIDHPNVGLTLDVAHLFIAANDLGFDYFDAVELAAPWVRHLHVNDNFGRLDRAVDDEPDRWPFGEADIHLPPGWGAIPLREVFARLPDYEGSLILEIKSGFRDYLGECLETMRGMVGR